MLKNRLSRLIVCFVIVAAIRPSALSAQSPVTKSETPSNCEELRHILDESILSAAGANAARVIFIFTFGKQENSKALMDRRMKTVKNHIIFRSANVNRFLFAQGEKNQGLGKLEVYIKGKLEWELYAKRNSDFGYDCLKEPF